MNSRARFHCTVMAAALLCAPAGVRPKPFRRQCDHPRGCVRFQRRSREPRHLQRRTGPRLSDRRRQSAHRWASISTRCSACPARWWTSSIKVGLSAQGYPFAAPSGIVDYSLHRPENEPGASVVANFDSFGTPAWKSADPSDHLDAEPRLRSQRDARRVSRRDRQQQSYRESQPAMEADVGHRDHALLVAERRL